MTRMGGSAAFEPVLHQRRCDAEDLRQLGDGAVRVFGQIFVADEQPHSKAVGLDLIPVDGKQRAAVQKRRVGLGVQQGVAQLVGAGEPALAFRKSAVDVDHRLPVAPAVIAADAAQRLFGDDDMLLPGDLKRVPGARLAD